MKKMNILLMLLISLIILTACSLDAPDSESEDASNDHDGALTIGFSISTLNNPFFVTLVDGAEAQAEARGASIRVIDAEDDVSKQISDVEDLIQQNVDIILINPTDSTSVGKAVESANQAGIPVITVDRISEGGDVAVHVASDNVEGGKLAGELMVELIGEGSAVAELEGFSGSSAARERGEGFHTVADNQLTVVTEQTANFSRAEGLTVMENILQSESDLKGVFAHNDEMALGAIEAAEAAGLSDLVIIGFDATADAVKAVEEGRLSGTIGQRPLLIGQEAIDAAIALANDEEVDAFFPVALEIVR